MTVISSPYQLYFAHNDSVSIGIHLPDSTFAEDSATLLSIDNDLAIFEMWGNGFSQLLEIVPGVAITVMKHEGRELFHCTGTVLALLSTRVLKIRLTGKILQKDRREYTRTELLIQMHYTVPASQNLGEILREWEEKKSFGLDLDKTTWNKEAIGSQNKVNLSGNGIRFRIRDPFAYGTLLHLEIVLPDRKGVPILGVGSIVRSVELLPAMVRNAYYSTAMTLRMVDKNDRRIIMEHIFSEQRKFSTLTSQPDSPPSPKPM